jgi:hypothetical protein
MPLPFTFRTACAVASLFAVLQAHAGSFASSASSAGSSASNSASDSLQASSNSSTRDDKSADADYRITEIAQAPDRPGVARLRLQADDPGQRLTLDLPQAIVEAEGLRQGDRVRAQHRVYGMQFVRAQDSEPFYLVIADDWFSELAARPVGL